STSWRSAAGGPQSLTVDLLRDREYGGLTLRWTPGAGAIDYDVDTSTDSANAFFRHVAAESPRGTYPRYLSSQQSYWTVVGISGGRHTGLLNEDGMLESDQGQFSV